MKQFMVRNIPEKTIAGIDDLAKQMVNRVKATMSQLLHKLINTNYIRNTWGENR